MRGGGLTPGRKSGHRFCLVSPPSSPFLLKPLPQPCLPQRCPLFVRSAVVGRRAILRIEDRLTLILPSTHLFHMSHPRRTCPSFVWVPKSPEAEYLTSQEGPLGPLIEPLWSLIVGIWGIIEGSWGCIGRVKAHGSAIWATRHLTDGPTGSRAIMAAI